MNEQILLPPVEGPKRKFWKRWKWIGLAVYAFALIFARWLPGPLIAIAYIYGIVVIANLLFAGFGYLKDRFFWRVRNRLLGSFVFVGIIPLLMLMGVVTASAYFLLGQLAAQYLRQSLQENVDLISAIDAQLARETVFSKTSGTLRLKASQIFSAHSAQFPRLSSRLLRRSPEGPLEVISKYDPQGIIPDVSPYPGDKWLGNAASFKGILKHQERAFLASLQQVPGSTGLYVETMAPLDNYIQERLRREKSLYVSFLIETIYAANRKEFDTKKRINTSPGVEASATANRIAKKVVKNKMAQDVPPESDPRRMITWILPLVFKMYESGKDRLSGGATFSVPVDVVFKTYLGQDASQNNFLLFFIYVLSGVFLFTWFVSLIIGVTISRHVTRSVHDVYQGILALQRGDLHHRIPVRRKDQLGLLAYAFNQMTGSISRLLDEVVEKKRLEQELKIAREVQTTLFPKQLPQPPGMSVYGGCKPAQVVSGDYYDFIVEDKTRLDIVVGDISGKGISAALLMANLQAAMRSQLLSIKHDDPEAIGQSLANVMAQLNEQIYLSSPPEKYATLFLGRYDADTHRLWYCNAGHPPAMALNAQGVQTLETTGTIVGMFPGMVYEAKFINLTPGTLLAIYTDGVTEALNKADEQFGDRQLLEALQQSSTYSPEDIWKHVMSKVGAWQSDLPQHDDITLIVAKAG